MGIGYGTILKYQSNVPPTTPVYAALAKVVDCKGPSLEVPKKDKSSNDSPNATKEYEPGMGEPGEHTFTIRYSSAVMIILIGLFRKTISWTVTYPDTKVWTFVGFWTKLETADPLDDEQMIDVTVQVSDGTYTFV